ncbi:ribonuclease-3 family protein [Kineothrix alysoides]|uniref:Mini-ribonuclease 3 n=1 Tax=Kineothrix alysoides TaxID=1469948 RepID=A0A4R1R0W1_9FIRM|nr:ribonuclease III domain-containing protein [Kineothrix alysoides]TCL58945.1 ribonuclease-3 family protein [Kineothrix alysoides]
MEESLIAKLKREFNCKEVDINEYSPLTLAYIGDSIYDVIVRTVVVERGNRSANNLHKMAIKYVNAATQAAMADALQEELTEDELTVYRRGRNAKSYAKAKNATLNDYRKATGMEALLGYLYLQDNMDRIIELMKLSLHKINIEL